MSNKKSRLDKTFMKSLDKINFFYGQGIQKNWVSINEKFLDYVESKYRQSVKASLLAGQIIVTKVNKLVIKQFKIKDEQAEYLAKLKFWK